MHRCYVEPGRWGRDSVRLSPDEAHYLVRVLRAKPGETVVVFDGLGRQAMALVERPRADQSRDACAGRHELILKLSGREVPERPPGIWVTLIQAIPKGNRMDWIIEKATELGVTQIVPTVSQRVIVRLNGEQRAQRRARWQRVAVSAARQCGTAWIPDILPVCDFCELSQYCSDNELFIVGSLERNCLSLRSLLAEWRGKTLRRLAVLIGPEGDLTPEELKTARELGAVPVSFGPRVYRVETAAVYALSVLAYEFEPAVQR